MDDMQNREDALFEIFGNLTDTVCQIQNGEPNFTLSWSHYLVLMCIENPDECHFYEIECQQENEELKKLQKDKDERIPSSKK